MFVFLSTMALVVIFWQQQQQHGLPHDRKPVADFGNMDRWSYPLVEPVVGTMGLLFLLPLVCWPVLVLDQLNCSNSCGSLLDMLLCTVFLMFF